MRPCIRLALACLLALAAPTWAGVAMDAVDDRVTFGDLTAWDCTNSTCTTVLSFTATASGSTQYLLARRASSGGAGGWFGRLDGTGLLTWRLLNDSNGSAGERATTASVADGTLKHLAVVWTTNTTTLASNDALLYVNGVQDSPTRTDGGGVAYRACTTGTCTLTAGMQSDLPSGSSFGGTLHRVAIYPVALTAEELTTVGKGGLQRPGLSRASLGLWPFDSCVDGAAGDGVTVPDRSGNGRSGTIARGANATGATCRATTLAIPWGPY